jgi:chaperone modulatory protein CbpM
VDIYMTTEELATAAGLSAARVERLVRVGLLDATAPGPSPFTAATAARLRRMLRLRRDLGVNLGGAAIIVDLVEQLERLERELARRRQGS